MTRVKIDIDMLTEFLERVERTTKELESAASAMQRLAHELSGNWTGSAAQSFATEVTEWAKMNEIISTELKHIRASGTTARDNWIKVFDADTRMWGRG